MMEHLIQIADNSKKQINKDSIKDLLPFAGKPIKDITSEDYPNLLIFPQSLSDCKDRIQDSPIFSMQGVDTLASGNIMGFVGKGDTRLRIYSRFAKEDGQDWFLHYMLQKVFHINLFDLQYGSDRDEIFDFLMYLFPDYLTRAYRQGLYKEYQTFNHNDAHIRGRIDIARHIRQNIPFTGKVAYQTREYTYNNALTQLIRHTIEYIRAQSLYAPILRNNNDTQEAVRAIEQATPNYNRQERQSIIHHNLRPIRHPYFSEYCQLQQLCLQILRHKELKYSNTKDQIYGILFVGAWLWEEYLAMVLKPLGLKHYIRGKETQYLFDNPKSQPIVPDYMNRKLGIVADAKYIPLDSKSIVAESESALSIYYKTLVYMYRFHCSKGFLFYPHRSDEHIVRTYHIGEHDNELLHKIGLFIPQTAEKWEDFYNQIIHQEQVFTDHIKTLIKS